MTPSRMTPNCTCPLLTGPSQVTLTFSSFKLSVIINGLEAVSLNSRTLFDFEHTRQKQVCASRGIVFLVRQAVWC